MIGRIGRLDLVPFFPAVEIIMEELDRQAGELNRIARAIDGAAGPESRVELQVGRLLQGSQEQLYADIPEDFPAEMLNERMKALVRISAHRQAHLFVAAALDESSGGDLKAEIDRRHRLARDARPIALEVQLDQAPIAYPPDMIERDSAGLVFETHEDILALLRDAAEA